MSTGSRKNFLDKHPELANEAYLFADGLDYDLRQQVDAFRASVAICDLQRRIYSFVAIAEDCQHFVESRNLSFDDFYQLIHVEDREHFNEICQVAFDFADAVTTSLLENYALLLEIRLKDLKGSYHRFILKYRVVNCSMLNPRYHLVLILNYLRPCNTRRAPVGCSIMDTSRHCYAHTFKQKRISTRELAVQRLVMQGLANKEIADALGLSVRTVEVHRSNIRQKTFSRNQTAAQEWLRIWGLL